MFTQTIKRELKDNRNASKEHWRFIFVLPTGINLRNPLEGEQIWPDLTHFFAPKVVIWKTILQKNKSLTSAWVPYH